MGGILDVHISKIRELEDSVRALEDSVRELEDSVSVLSDERLPLIAEISELKAWKRNIDILVNKGTK